MSQRIKNDSIGIKTEKQSLRIAVLSISDSRSTDNDPSGDLLQKGIKDEGHVLCDRVLVKDDCYQIRYQVSRWIASEDTDVIITTGGTGVTGRDGTPEAIRPLLDKEIDGFSELFRALSYTQIGTSTIQSRMLSGVANATYLFVLPGSKHACQTAWSKIISQQLDSRTVPCNLVQLMPRLKESEIK